jgi:small GTP-binding protein
MSSFSSEFDHLFKIQVLGDEGVGKTSLILRFISDIFVDRGATSLPHLLMMNTRTIDTPDGKSIKLQVCDAPQHKGSLDNKRWMEASDAYVVAFDLSKRETFQSIREDSKSDLDRYGHGKPVIVVGCKADSESRAFSYEEVQKYCKSANFLYIETSAKTGENVQQAFEKLALKCVEQALAKRPPVVSASAAGESAPVLPRTKADLILELTARISELRAEAASLFSMNKELKRRKFEALEELKEQLEATAVPIAGVVHAFRSAHMFLEEGKHSRTTDLLNKYDPDGPAAK